MDGSPNISRSEGGLDPLGPVVVVGQARSGSTLATWLLNGAAGGLVINDAYAAQLAEGLGAPGAGPGGARALARFRGAALARIAARSVGGEAEAAPRAAEAAEAAEAAPSHRPTRSLAAMRAAGVAEAAGATPLHRPTRLTAAMRAAEVAEAPGAAPLHRPTRLTAAMRAAAEAAEGADWARLWGAMLHGAAAAGGRAFWGWNTPPDWTRAAEIRAAFPRARFVFVTRGLWSVLRSYKGLPAHWGWERARAHPALQARAWAAAARAEARLAAEGAAVHRLAFEALLARPEAELAALGAFLGAPVAAAAREGWPRNASDPGARLGAAEIWAARLALGRAGRAAAGPAPAAAGLGLGALARATLRAGAFYGGGALVSRDMRGRLARMAWA